MQSLSNLLTTTIKDRWIDYNGHMGDFAYPLVFNEALEAFFELLGTGEKYRKETGCTIYTLETHTSFLNELFRGDVITVSAQLLDYDQKRIHLVLSMIDNNKNVCACYEIMLLHVSLRPGEKPVSESLPSQSLQALEAILKEHLMMARPEIAHSSISIRRS